MFRQDLFFRLNLITVHLPSLRDRRDEIIPIAESLLRQLDNKYKKSMRIDADCSRIFEAYDFPGNIRELENVLERAVLVCDGQVVHAHHLPPSLQTAESSGTVTRVSLRAAVEAYEKDMIQDTLKTTRGNRAKAARLLDTTERVLNYKVRQLAIDYQRFKV